MKVYMTSKEKRLPCSENIEMLRMSLKTVLTTKNIFPRKIIKRKKFFPTTITILFKAMLKNLLKLLRNI